MNAGEGVVESVAGGAQVRESGRDTARPRRGLGRDDGSHEPEAIVDRAPVDLLVADGVHQPDDSVDHRLGHAAAILARVEDQRTGARGRAARAARDARVAHARHRIEGGARRHGEPFELRPRPGIGGDAHELDVERAHGRDGVHPPMGVREGARVVAGRVRGRVRDVHHDAHRVFAEADAAQLAPAGRRVSVEGCDPGHAAGAVPVARSDLVQGLVPGFLEIASGSQGRVERGDGRGDPRGARGQRAEQREGGVGLRAEGRRGEVLEARDAKRYVGDPRPDRRQDGLDQVRLQGVDLSSEAARGVDGELDVQLPGARLDVHVHPLFRAHVGQDELEVRGGKHRIRRSRPGGVDRGRGVDARVTRHLRIRSRRRWCVTPAASDEQRERDPRARATRGGPEACALDQPRHRGQSGTLGAPEPRR